MHGTSVLEAIPSHRLVASQQDHLSPRSCDALQVAPVMLTFRRIGAGPGNVGGALAVGELPLPLLAWQHLAGGAGDAKHCPPPLPKSPAAQCGDRRVHPLLPTVGQALPARWRMRRAPQEEAVGADSGGGSQATAVALVLPRDRRAAAAVPRHICLGHLAASPTVLFLRDGRHPHRVLQIIDDRLPRQCLQERRVLARGRRQRGTCANSQKV